LRRGVVSRLLTTVMQISCYFVHVLQLKLSTQHFFMSCNSVDPTPPLNDQPK